MSVGIFEKQFEVGWRDMDMNGHMANISYLPYAVHTRVAFFASCGFGPGEFQKQGFGPVTKNDCTEYFRELKMLEAFSVTMENGGFSDDGSRFRIVNNFYKSDGTRAACVTSVGGWLDLEKRKLILPPEELKAAWLELLVKTEDFEELKSSVRR